MNVTNRKEKVDEKMRSFVYFPCFLHELWSLNCPKKCNFFLQFCVDLSKKPKFVKAIYIYASESSHYTLQKMIWFIVFG